ncbi:SDR family NAD(P)-dependent oxidoreductase [Amnibacterium setariae]|uniref:SDR family NAD(P)-dependent oxidoreductase n=1 Tax=Amnibacterium setariae TaxID=2306585 RepID=A0A3A1U258_9MICO|nr:SDR family NAD(P)-dependent oxidoreductase [Amnibacterium setariae]RIX30601.1 SDR family NAD(P)-dependent oxidoreductase [Amnibacterium setariae]
MARVLITGSADGLGLAVGQRLIDQGHETVLHARSAARAEETRRAAPGAADVLVGDLGSDAETHALAEAANASGRFDAVIHNAGVGSGGGEALLTVNVLAPYLLTALMTRPDRLVYLSSGMHRSGRPDLAHLDRPSYGDSKLFDAALAAAVARRWTDVRSNAVDPGWIKTRMGGAGAPGSLDEGSATQIWLATSDDPAARVSGRYFKDLEEERPAAGVVDERFQDALLAALADRTGVPLPA